MNRILLLLLLLFAGTAYSQAPSTPFASKFPRIERYLDSLMKSWEVPGMGIAIVYKDQLIYSRGLGYRDLANKLPFDTKTLFPVASNTKLITSTVALMMQEEGLLDLDVPVRQYHSSLRFYNEELNERITMRDLLSHRTGLGNYDGLWVNDTCNRDELVRRIQYMKPELGFREGFIYNNMMYVAAGSVLERVGGMSWETLLRKKIFSPLSMNTTCFTYEDMRKSGNYLVSYYKPDTNMSLLPRQFRAIPDALGPAGTIKSNLEDLSHWMVAQLGKGKYREKQVFSTDVYNQTLVANSIGERTIRWPELSNSLYGLGRGIQFYKGIMLTRHTGSIDGYYSSLTILPGKELAIFMVLNQDEAGSLRSVMALPVIDLLLDLNYTPWIQRYRQDYLANQKQFFQYRDSTAAMQVKNTQPSHSLENYTGRYTHPAYGEINITLENGQLVVLFRQQRSLLYHFHYDQFVTKETKNDNPDFRFHFLTNEKGAIDRLLFGPYGDKTVEFEKKK